MLSAGVEFERIGFTVTLLSETYAWLAENSFSNARAPSVLSWLAAFKSKAPEKVRWYFDATAWAQDDNPTHLFRFTDAMNPIYLIKHRALCNLGHFWQECCFSHYKSAAPIKRSWLIASAASVLGPGQIKRWVPRPEIF
jgi:hypothetical protein